MKQLDSYQREVDKGKLTAGAIACSAGVFLASER